MRRVKILEPVLWLLFLAIVFGSISWGLYNAVSQVVELEPRCVTNEYGNGCDD